MKDLMKSINYMFNFMMLMKFQNNLCNVIKEYLMIETIFEIGKFNKQASPSVSQSLSSYNTLCQ